MEKHFIYCNCLNEFPFYKLNLTSDGLYLSGADGFSSFLDMAGCDRVTVAYYGNYFSDPGAQFSRAPRRLWRSAERK